MIEKLIHEADEAGATFVEFVFSDAGIAFVSNISGRKSTRNFKLDKKEITLEEKMVKTIDDRYFVFAKYLLDICFTLQDGRKAYFKRNMTDSICAIRYKRINEKNEKASLWIIENDKENEKIGVAYRLNDKQNEVISCEGCILSGVVNTSLTTDLQFLVNANFYVKDNNLDIRYESENALTLAILSEVMARSIRKIFRMKLANMSFFTILPNTMDDDNIINMALVKSIKKVCQNYPLFKNQAGTYVNISKMIHGTDEVKNLFEQKLIGQLFDEDKYWIRDCKPESRTEYFLMDIGIKYYDREAFLNDIFSEENFDALSLLISKQGDKWLRKFYVFCAQEVLDRAIYNKMITGIRNLKFVRDKKGTMKYPYEVSVANYDDELMKNASVMKRDLIYPDGIEDDWSESLMHFFVNKVGVEEYSLESEIRMLAVEMATKKQKIDEKYCDKLLTLAKYDQAHIGEVDFSEYAIIPVHSNRGISRIKISEVMIGKPYIKEGNLLAAAYDRKCLWQGFKKILSEDEINILISFIENHGGLGVPKVKMSSAENHPNFKKSLYVQGKLSAKDSNYDFCVPELEALLRRHSFQINKLIWNAIIELDNPENVLYAEYSCDNRTVVNKIDSSLVTILRERVWVPNKEKKLFQPENIKIADIHDDFLFDSKNVVLKKLYFGSGEIRRESELKKLKHSANKLGYEVISLEEYKEFINWKKDKH